MTKGSIAKINDFEIYYELTNWHLIAEDKTLLVLLHEGLGSIGQWKNFPSEISERLNLPVLCYDRLGYGKSSVVETRTGEYLKHEAGFILPQLLKHLDYNKQVSPFGHSDGATVALIFAALNPKSTKKVIAAAPHVIIEDLTANGVKQAVEAYTKGKLKTRLEKYHGNKTEQMFWSWAGFWSKESSRSWNMLELLEKIESPVLFIQGDKDHFGTLNQGEEIKKRVQDDYQELIIENCGHVPHFESKKEVLHAVAKFCNPQNPVPESIIST